MKYKNVRSKSGEISVKIVPEIAEKFRLICQINDWNETEMVNKIVNDWCDRFLEKLKVQEPEQIQL